MKKIVLVLGILILLISFLSLRSYILDYAILTQYGKGYIWGNIILVSLGIFMIYIGIKKNKVKP